MKRVRKSKTARRGTVMSVLGGSFLTREDFSKIFPFLVYLTVLLMLLITNAYIAESTSRAIKKTPYSCAICAWNTSIRNPPIPRNPHRPS